MSAAESAGRTFAMVTAIAVLAWWSGPLSWQYLMGVAVVWSVMDVVYAYLGR